MSVYYILFIIFLTFFGCEGKKTTDYTVINEHSELIESSTFLQKDSVQPVIDTRLILGFWGKDIGENASFIIKKDSIYNVDHFTSIKYVVRHDSLYTIVDNEPYVSKILLLTIDSLWLDNDNEIQKYVRLKN